MCPICEALDWKAVSRAVDSWNNEIQYFEYSVCGQCGFDLVLPSQQRNNDILFRKMTDM